MDSQTLEKANRLKEGIRKLKNFIDSIERIGNCSAIFYKREPRFIAKRVSLPWSGEIEYELDKTTEHRMLDVLRNRLKELETELERL